jgi:gamma-glutamyltranspeptidase/glutathione hydrolase
MVIGSEASCPPSKKESRMSFTTRPELIGTFGMVASTHWLASASAMAVLEKGGNAFDAAAAAGFVLQIVEPHLNGPGGELPVVFYSAREDRVRVLCGQGVTPAAMTIERMRKLGLEVVPGTGLLPAVVPGAFGGWMAMLRDYGQLPLEDVLSYAIGYAENGYPVLPRMTSSILAIKDFFRTEWTTSAEQWRRAHAEPAVRQSGDCQHLQAHSARSECPERPRRAVRTRPRGVLPRLRG